MAVRQCAALTIAAGLARAGRGGFDGLSHLRRHDEQRVLIGLGAAQLTQPRHGALLIPFELG
ncbi:hypothetical protein [Streptomyces sp. NPDC058695]|uniref:hypothetical protein n=1 Tax=Streptomyces sp. NPDC058695 TaxID=3346604 RepID=UPI00364EEB6D